MKSKEKIITRKTISIILLFAIILMQITVFPTQVKAAASVDFSFTTEKNTPLQAGDEVEITISTSGDPISSFSCLPVYDTSIFNEIKSSDFTLNSPWVVGAAGLDGLSMEEQEIVINVPSGTRTGVIGTLKLTVKDTLTTPVNKTTVSFEQMEVTASTGYLSDFEDFVCEIGGEEPTTPTLETYDISYCITTPPTNIYGCPSTAKKTQGVDYIIRGENMGAEGYTFLEWNTDQYGNGTSYLPGDVYSEDKDLTIYSIWQKNVLTLTIDLNGGSWNNENSLTGAPSSSVTISGTPTTTAKGNRVTFNVNGSGASLNNMVSTYLIQNKVFDKWEKTSGDGTLNGATYTFARTDASVQATYKNDAITLPTASRPGYTFDGWYDQATGGTKIGNAGFEYYPDSDVTIYAHWTANTYTITFNPGDGQVSPTTKTVTYGQTYGQLPTPTKEGYTFEGWYIGNTKIEATSTVNITADAQLTAKWTGTEYTLTVDPNGGKYNGSTSNATLTGTYQEDVTLSTPTKDGYTVTLVDGDNTTTKVQENRFKEWTVTAGSIDGSTYTFAASNATATASYEGQAVALDTPTKAGYTFAGWNTQSNGNGTNYTTTITPTEDITLYAKWTPNTYTVTFNPGDGEVEQTSKEVTIGDTYGTLPIPTKDDYDFVGWFDENGNQITEDTIVNISDDTVLIAKWTQKEYEITFDFEDSSTANTSKTLKNGEEIGTLPESNRPGYRLVGWYDNNGNKVESTDVLNTRENITLHARYELITYTIEYRNLKGYDNSLNPTTYTVEDENITLQNLEGTGFAGWYSLEFGKGNLTTIIDTSRAENIIVYAHWEGDKLYLKSDVYMVGETDIDNYEYGDMYLNKITPYTTVAELVANCDTNGEMIVLDSNGDEVSADKYVGTGMTIKTTGYGEEFVLTAVVMGDLDGNGKLSVTDLSVMNHVIVRTQTLQGAFFEAADLDDSNRITATDLSTINQALVRTIELTYTKPN